MIHLHNHEKQHRTKNTCEESKTGLGAFFSRNLGPDHLLFLESSNRDQVCAITIHYIEF